MNHLSFTEAGREFHIVGASKENERRPISLHVRISDQVRKWVDGESTNFLQTVQMAIADLQGIMHNLLAAETAKKGFLKIP